jgi:hypothetical protein
VIALVFSALIAVYLLIPNAWFRLLLGLFVPLRIFQESKIEDLTRAAVTLALIFVIALTAVWYVPGLKDHPLNFTDDAQLRASDYITVASGLYSEPIFKEYGPKFWNALWRTLKRQGRFACWYYVLVSLFAVADGMGSRHYGRLKRFKAYSKFADLYLLPHISQWYVLLTPFTFPDRRTLVKADVLMTDETLYRGDVIDHFLDKDGNLSGLILGNPARFDRRRYLREQDVWGTTRPRSTYWRSIPSAKLYLFADKVVNLNVNYEPPIAIPEVVARYLWKLQKRPIVVSVSPGGSSPLAAQKPEEKGRGSFGMSS